MPELDLHCWLRHRSRYLSDLIASSEAIRLGSAVTLQSACFTHTPAGNLIEVEYEVEILGKVLLGVVVHMFIIIMIHRFFFLISVEL